MLLNHRSDALLTSSYLQVTIAQALLFFSTNLHSYVANVKFCDVPIVLQLISLEDLCASRYISWKNTVLCSCLLLLNDLVVSLAVMPYSSYDLPTEQKMLSICTSRHPKQLWTECSFRMPSSSSSEWGYTHLLILTVLDSHDMDMRNLCRCFSRRSRSSSQEMTCAHLTRGWTRFSCISLVVQVCMEQIRFKHRNFPRNLAPIKIQTVK